MGENKNKKGKKIGFGVLFIASCFIAMYILMGFHGDMVLVGVSAVLLLISAFLFLNAMFEERAKEWSRLPEEEERKEVPSTAANGDGEFRMKLTKHMKEMENSQKEMLAILKKQNVILQTQIENLENEIYMLSEKQIKQTKMLIKYNKENARQLAISERETLEHVLTEVKQAIEDNAVVMPMVAAAAVSTEEASAAEESFAEPSEMAVADIQAGEVLEEVPDSELFAVPELPADDEYEEPDMAELLDSIQEEPVDIPGFDETPEVPEIADIPGLDEIPEVPEIADIPGLDEMPEVPEIADIPGLDEMPEVPEIADIPGLDEMPEVPEIADIPGLDEMPEVPEIADIPGLDETPEVPEIADIPGLDEIPEIADIPGLDEIPEVPETAAAKEPEPAPAPSNPNAMMTPEDIAKLLESMGR
ncbi:MAG: hypothetical protein J6J42_07005 [Lachnospiraceae bacterium]|nr:hypothetical protein [Lachnospiraceae bacterium]